MIPLPEMNMLVIFQQKLVKTLELSNAYEHLCRGEGETP